ncbi:MAG: hypothetical protein RMX68_007240 [Aulosira sp. ZfuVER01]|nr:hypothetical protein [Aulosira sp. ZfuVER01]MDZ8001728.1 hypothetical protein [Aulosira sp. DedVER01a]MDZ8056494.1 hypothetical protein [Aulosira sp. ZfuCHP01]
MANINIKDLLNLNLTGAELFNDSESFLNELSDESEQVIGGHKTVYCQLPSCKETKVIIKAV